MVAASCSSALLFVAGCVTPGKPAAGSSNPDEEVWAIRCLTLHAADRFDRANAYADALKRVPGLRPELVQVVTDEDGTAVFYGRYQREYGPDGATERFKPDQLTDLKTIRELSVRTGTGDAWPFYLAEMDVLPTYRSPHPEWNLAQAEGYWSLHVAVFYNTAQFRSRRSAAEEYCAMLREKGEEAYFHHGTVNSSVYVGLYPEGAVTEVRREDPLAGRMTTTLKVADPRMSAAQERFPTSLQNGHTIYEVTRNRDGQVTQRSPAPSFPVVVPKANRAQNAGAKQPEPRPSGAGAFRQ
jgi:hypothetical protein